MPRGAFVLLLAGLLGVLSRSLRRAPFRSEFEALQREGAPPRVSVIDRSDRLYEYEGIWELQKGIMGARVLRARGEDPGAGGGGAGGAMGGGVDALVVAQHPSTYTLGTGSTEDNFKFDASEREERQYQIFRTERGGEVTWHGPGQLVLYPILDLRGFRCDLHWYVRALEEVVIRALGDLGVEGAGRIEGLTGVWVGGAKVAAVGVKVKSWVTMHGVAVNVEPDLADGFHRIVPCGISDRPVTRVKDLCADVSMDAAKAALLSAFADVFEVELESAAAP